MFNIMGVTVNLPKYYVAEILSNGDRVRVTADMLMGDAAKAMNRMKGGRYELVEA